MNKIPILLTADGGSTKTMWQIATTGRELAVMETSGLNPFTMDEAEMRARLQAELQPRLLQGNWQVKEVAYYGAGCTGEGRSLMARLLAEVTGCTAVVVDSDIVGAARCLCGQSEGIACILGTGASSCLYDGQRIVAHTPCLGYILGDEGSGAVLGRRLVGDVFKGQLPEVLCEAFVQEMAVTADSVIAQVYRAPSANRYLASFAPFLGRHIAHPAIRAMVVEEFRRFFVRNVKAYRRADLPVHFVGSIAYFLRDALAEAARAEGFTLGQVRRRIF
ncbi:MAG: ATPase [Bacteroidales bacterium]|nr:ATPase [Candidatus Equimonas enterica]